MPKNECGADKEVEEQGQPVSPISQSLSSSLLSLRINAIFEFEEPITEISRGKKALAEIFLPSNPLFSCIMEEDDRGVLRWQKRTVNIDDHMIIPKFPPGEESYDAWVEDYISKLALTPFDQSRPLWEFHLLNYKTSKAGATMVIKLHHALGDGISFMSTLFALVTRVDNPHLPPTFPSSRSTASSKQFLATYIFHKIWYIMLLVWYTLVDVISSSLRTMGWIEDSQLPIRGPPGVEYMPMAHSSATFQLEDIRKIKNAVGGTVNDVMTGIIFYGLQLYLQFRLSTVTEQTLQDASKKRFELMNDSVIKQMKSSRVTALCLLNTRVLAGIQNMGEMLKPKTQAPWGNHFGFLHVRVPIMAGKAENPLEFVRMAKRIIDRHKMSLGVFINAGILRCLARLRGPQAISRYLYNNIANTTMAISNMIGPMEKIAMDGNPIKSFSFFVSGAPQSLSVFIVSYMGTVKMEVMAQKAYIDANALSQCFMEAFGEIKKAASIDHI